MAKVLEKLRRMSQWPGFDEVVGLLLLLLAAISLLALGSHAASDPTWFLQLADPAPVRNLFGRVGANLSELLWQGLGTAAWLVHVVLGVTGWNRFRGRGAATSWGRFAGLAAATLFLTALLDLWIGWVEVSGERYRAGGVAGYALGGALRETVGVAGGIVVAAVLLAALSGMSVVAAGLIFATFAKVVRVLPRRWLPVLFAILAFVGIGVLRWPLLWVIGALAPAALFAAWKWQA